MPQLQGLIFDLDGTLLDSAPDLRQAINLMLAEHGRRALTLDEVKEMIGEGAMMLVQRALSKTGPLPPDTDIYPYVKQFIEHYHHVGADPSQIYPHAEEVLKDCHAKGVKLGICTNKQQASSHKVLDELGLRKYFEFIAGGDTFLVHKPNPEHLLGVITALDVPKESCVFVGDGLNDIRAAHGAKVPCIVVTHGYGLPPEELENADAAIAGFEELPNALKSLGFTLS